MKISCVPPEHVHNVWPIVEPMLQRAVDKNPGLYTTEDIKLELLESKQLLWIIYQDGEIEAACTSKVLQFPRGRSLLIEWLGGEKMDAWLDDAMDMIEAYASDMGCSRVEVYGRKGWKVLKRYGWKDVFSVYRKELKQEE